MIYLLYTTVELFVEIVNQLSHLGGLQGPTESILDMGRMGDMTNNSEESWVVQSVYFVAILMWVDPNWIPFLPKVGQGTFGLNSLIHDCLIYPLVNCHIATENLPIFKT